MSLSFGFFAKFEFFQTWASILSANISPAVIHNVEKYHMLKKVHYLCSIEEIDGDYLEFGVYTGSSFCHSIRVYRKQKKQDSKQKKMHFFGFDSFCGFGDIDEDDTHPFYSQVDFSSSINRVHKRVKRVAKGIDFKLIPGYFEESLKFGATHYGIDKSLIIFIDSDTYSSSSSAFKFCLPTVQQGTYVILDDYFSYKGSIKKGVARAFSEFLKEGNLSVRKVLTYGLGGCVYVISDIKSDKT